MHNPHSRPLTFPMNKAEYISALYNTLASIGHDAATKGYYSKVIPSEIETKLIHIRTVMDWMNNNDSNIGLERIEINDEGEISILPPMPETEVSS